MDVGELTEWLHRTSVFGDPALWSVASLTTPCSGLPLRKLVIGKMAAAVDLSCRLSGVIECFEDCLPQSDEVVGACIQDVDTVFAPSEGGQSAIETNKSCGVRSVMVCRKYLILSVY